VESDFNCPEATFLTTWAENAPRETCNEYTYTSDANPWPNANWNHTQGLRQALNQSVRAAQDALIAAARASCHVIVRCPFPVMSAEEEDKLNVLVSPSGHLLGAHNPEAPVPAGHRIGNLKSVYQGKFEFKSGTDFANVIGSSDDPKVDGSSWKALWKAKFPTENGDQCASAGWASGGKFDCSANKDTNYVGGHVIFGQKASAVAAGANNTVYIIPICKGHNNNNNVYMNPITLKSAVALNNYFRS